MMLTVVMSTYLPDGETGRARLSYAKQATILLHHNLCGDYKLLIAHDGPENSLLLELLDHASEYYNDDVSIMSGPHNGIGSSLNRALRAVDDTWMYTTDDFCLTRPLNLDKPLALINAGYDYVRLLLHPDIHCRVKFAINLGWFLELNEQKGGYVVATRPFLMSKHFTDELGQWMRVQGNVWHGPFVEGADSYETERVLNQTAIYIGNHVRELKLAATLSDGTEWEHIGVIEVGHEAIA